MDWDRALFGFLDELEKVSAFNTRGLSTETVLDKSQPPPPMETAGFDKARNILDRAAQTKTASSKHVQRALPTQPGIGKLTHQGDNSRPEQAKSVAGYGLAGLGAGGAVHKAYTSAPSIHAALNHPDLSSAQRFASSAKVNHVGHKMMVGSAVAGLGYGAYRAHKKSQMAKQGTIVKTATLTSPAMALKASTQVGKAKVTPSAAGPSTTTQIRGQLIGKKGIP